jgi:hypothetical protein
MQSRNSTQVTGEPDEEQSKEHAHHFSDIKGIVRKEFVLAGQTVNFAYYCDILRGLCENDRRLRSELWRQKNWLLHHDYAPSHNSFFARKFVTKNNITVGPHPPYTSLFTPS